jgi:uncharacterized membrane protein YdjX (TVP38/TMEM64 family)
MERYWAFVSAILSFLLLIFLLVEAMDVPLLTDPSPSLGSGDMLAGLVGVGLLVADVVLPVPSSTLMIAHGALFGLVGGTLLSLAGSMGAALVGFALGRRAGALLDRFVQHEERARADRLLGRWGALAIVITRPVPLLAETVTIMAGSSPLGWGRAALATLVGSLPPAFLYALTGTAAVTSLVNGALMFGLVLVVSGVFWLVGHVARTHIVRKKGKLS